MKTNYTWKELERLEEKYGTKGMHSYEKVIHMIKLKEKWNSENHSIWEANEYNELAMYELHCMEVYVNTMKIL